MGSGSSSQAVSKFDKKYIASTQLGTGAFSTVKLCTNKVIYAYI